MKTSILNHVVGLAVVVAAVIRCMGGASVQGIANDPSNKQVGVSILRREVPGDPYMLPSISREFGSESNAPPGSVQVNVNAAGMNIPGDAANEPSIAIDPTNPNRIAIGFRQFDTIASNFRQGGYAYSTNGGQTWTFPGVLEPGIFRSDPVLDASPTGVFYYNSLKSNFTCDVFRSTNGGQTWPDQQPAFGGDKAWMTVDRTGGIGNGNIYAYWSGTNNFTRSTDGGLTWMTPTPIPLSPVFGTLAVGLDGTLYVTGSGGAGFIVAKSSDAKNPAVTPTWDFSVSGDFLGGTQSSGGINPDGLLGQVWIAVSPRNVSHVFLLCSVNPPGPDPLDLRFSRSVNGGQTWSPSVRVNNDSTTNGAYQWFGTMSVSPGGRIDVIWNDTRDDPANQLSRLYYSYSMDEGVTWSPNVAQTPPWSASVGWPQQNKIGDYYHMISDTTSANLAYAATFNGEQDVYFTRIAANDCNNNGIADDIDIANGTSLDCNSNGYPDECEDCNSNGLADSCDIANGTSLDANHNGVPDECDPDLTPPTPNPMTFASLPSPQGTSSISMAANIATDVYHPPVQYFFDYVSGLGGHDSGWQASQNYTDMGLLPNGFYNYRVKARDSATPTPNETAYSATILAGTYIETPTGLIFGVAAPNAINLSAAGSFTNIGLGSTGFYFEMTPAEGSGANVWTSTPSITVSGLRPCATYSFRVKARNFQAVETPFTLANSSKAGCLLNPNAPTVAAAERN